MGLDAGDKRVDVAISAGRVLMQADMSGNKRKGLRDKLSAVLILQNYLDSK